MIRFSVEMVDLLLTAEINPVGMIVIKLDLNVVM